jgi:hypothetical protein
VIYADAHRIASIIVADHEMLRQMGAFLDAVTGDADIAEILAALPQAVAACSPFKNEAAMTEAVRVETLPVLRALALSRLPKRGTA